MHRVRWDLLDRHFPHLTCSMNLGFCPSYKPLQICKMSPLWFLLREIETAIINVTAWQCPGEENSPVAKGQIRTKATEFVTRKNKNKYELINALKGPYTSPRVRLPFWCNQTLLKVTWAAVSSSYMHKHWNEWHNTTNGTLWTANRSCQKWKQFAQTLLSLTFRFSQPSVLFEDSWGLSKGLQLLSKGGQAGICSGKLQLFLILKHFCLQITANHQFNGC